LSFIISKNSNNLSNSSICFSFPNLPNNISESKMIKFLFKTLKSVDFWV